jgi:hypothetical protein
MDAKGARVVTPALRAIDQGLALRPWVEPDNFNLGYLARGIERLPRQGEHEPWLHLQDYAADKVELPAADLDDTALVYR